MSESSHSLNLGSRRKALIIRGLISAFAALIISALAGKIVYAIRLDIETFRIFWFESLVALAVLIVGIGLYKLRQSQIFMYGILEVVFSLATAFHTTTKLKSDLLKNSKLGDDYAKTLAWLSLLGCVYIVVRGIDNVAKGWKEL